MSEMAQKKTLPVKDWLESETVKGRLLEAEGNKEHVDKFISAVLVETSREPKLQACTKTSIMQCCLDSLNFGLIPNKQTGHAWLIPYNNSYKGDDGKWHKRLECTLQIGYRGYVQIFGENGYSLDVETVTQREMHNKCFKEVRGTSAKIIHEPIREGVRDRENIVLGYAIAKKKGMEPTSIVMTKEEVEEIAFSDRSDAWLGKKRQTDYGEMFKKTLLRRLAKIVPISRLNILSDYEAERDGELKDVTPEEGAVFAEEEPKHKTALMYQNAPEEPIEPPQSDEKDSPAPTLPDEWDGLSVSLYGAVTPYPEYKGDMMKFIYLLQEEMAVADTGEKRQALFDENRALMNALVKADLGEYVTELSNAVYELENQNG